MNEGLETWPTVTGDCSGTDWYVTGEYAQIAGKKKCRSRKARKQRRKQRRKAYEMEMARQDFEYICTMVHSDGVAKFLVHDIKWIDWIPNAPANSLPFQVLTLADSSNFQVTLKLAPEYAVRDHKAVIEALKVELERKFARRVAGFTYVMLPDYEMCVEETHEEEIKPGKRLDDD